MRQKVLQYMIQSLGYPESGFVVEQSLHGMPHLKTKSKTYFPDRRADILFFSRGIHPEHDLYPLILIECKAVKLTPKVINQVTSYNFYLQSLAVAIANEQEIKMGWLGENGYQFQEGLASYSQMKSFLAYR
ncbi:MAG: type I restriction enzyme HsdR N-terminal domain-containing protein [Parachlamydiaceae bacterium]